MCIKARHPGCLVLKAKYLAFCMRKWVCLSRPGDPGLGLVVEDKPSELAYAQYRKTCNSRLYIDTCPVPSIE